MTKFCAATHSGWSLFSFGQWQKCYVFVSLLSWVIFTLAALLLSVQLVEEHLVDRTGAFKPSKNDVLCAGTDFPAAHRSLTPNERSEHFLVE